MIHRHSKRTILLAEDEEPIRILLKAVLEPEGYKLLIAADGQAAWELSRSYRGKIDLVLTDIVMPRMTGVELAERVCKARPAAKVLLLSGYGSDIKGEKPEWEFVAKPYMPQQLVQKVAGMLRG